MSPPGHKSRTLLKRTNKKKQPRTPQKPSAASKPDNNSVAGTDEHEVSKSKASLKQESVSVQKNSRLRKRPRPGVSSKSTVNDDATLPVKRRKVDTEESGDDREISSVSIGGPATRRRSRRNNIDNEKSQTF